MKRKERFSGCHEGCPVEAALTVMGGKWKGILLFHLMNSDDPIRFNTFERSLPNITRRMLTRQLRELQEDGLVSRTAYPEVPPRVEYALTEKGETLRPIIKALRAWGAEHVLDGEGRWIGLDHDTEE